MSNPIDRIEITGGHLDVSLIEVGVSGPAGTGLTGPEKADIYNRLDIIEDEIALDAETGIVCPLDFGAAGDNSTNDHAAIMAAYNALPASGGVLHLAGRTYYSASAITFTAGKPITIDGGAMAEVAGVPKGGAIRFSDGSSGITFNHQSGPTLRNVGIFTSKAGALRTAGTGNGLTFNAPLVSMQNVLVSGFGNDGIHYNAGLVANGQTGNFGTFTNVMSFYNGRDGIHLEGDDSNVHQWIGANVILNRRYGIYNHTFYHNTFTGAHAYGNVAGDYYDRSNSSMWLNPYSEGGAGKFIIHDASRVGTLIMGADVANFAAPIVHLTNGTSVWSIMTEAFARNAVNDLGWTIIRNGVSLTAPRYGDPVSGTVWETVPGVVVADSATLRNRAGGQIASHWGSGTDTNMRIDAKKLGFYEALPVVKPTVSGAKGGNAALTSLVTALKNLGLITDSTS